MIGGNDTLSRIQASQALVPVGKGLAWAGAAMPATAVTAGGGGDATEIDGTTIDTNTMEGRFTGMQFVVHGTATLTETKTLTVTANLQDSANGSAWADITTPAVILTLTGAGGGSTETGVGRLACDLGATRRYVRLQATPDLSATETDTAKISAIAVASAMDAGAATEIDGLTLDTQELTSRPNSVTILVWAKATLAQAATLILAANLQDSADGSNWTDITASDTLLTLTGATSGSTERGVERIGCDLRQVRRYVRLQVTPTLSSPTTDTAILGAVAIWSGLERT